MLYPAQLFKEELKRKLVSVWYDPKYQYYFSGDLHEFTVPDNTDWRQDFVHLDNRGSIDGFFSYNYNDNSKNMRNFGLISFTDNGIPLIYDAIKRVKYMFQMGAQKLEFWAFVDNPIYPTYKNMIESYGGHQTGYMKRSDYFNGKYHDVAFFELLVEDIVKKPLYIHKKDNKKPNNSNNIVYVPLLKEKHF